MKQIQLSVDHIVSAVRTRIEELTRLANHLGATIKKTPLGKLRVAHCNGAAQYYWVRTDFPEEYIPKENLLQAKALAQKTYDEKIKKLVLRQLDLLKNFEQKYVLADLVKQYESLNPDRKTLIEPYAVSDAHFAEIWKNVDYAGLEFCDKDAELVTSKNVRIRSKSEAIITGTLDRLNIPYRYEFPLHLKNNVCIHPDFICLNVRTRKEIVWEHFGMLDKLDYVNNFVLKMRTYSKNGYVLGSNLIFTVENKDIPLSPNVVENLARTHLL